MLLTVKSHILAFATFGLVVLLLHAANPVQAVDESVFYEYTSGTVTCNGGGIEDSTFSSKINYNSNTLSESVWTADGAVVRRRGGPALPQSQNYSNVPWYSNGTTFNNPGPDYPTTATVTIRTFINGQLNSESSITWDCSGGGETTVSFRFADADGRLDVVSGSSPTSLYAPDPNEDGNENFRVYVQGGNSDDYYEGLSVSPDDIAAVPESPEDNTEIASTDDNYLRFFRLTTGELQLNVGPDEEGKVHVYVMNPDTFGLNRSYTFTVD